MKDIQSLVRPSIKALKPYSSARDEYTGQIATFLDANENPYGDLNRYPDPYQRELKEELAQQNNFKTNQIFVGNGSDEVIDLAFRIFCEPGKEKAVICSPTYGVYRVSAAINNVEIVDMPLTSDFQLDLVGIENAISDDCIKLLFICSPNNPTGNLMRTSDIEFILNRFNGIVFLDEAYIDFADSDSLNNLINSYNNLIVSQTFSKARGLAGARVGVAYADPAIINLFNKAKPPYNVSSVNQRVALDALKNKQGFEANLRSIKLEKARLQKALCNLALVKRIYPSDANFLLLEVNDADKLYEMLLQKNVVVRNRSNQVKNTLRITIGTAEENNLLLKALNELT